MIINSAERDLDRSIVELELSNFLRKLDAADSAAFVAATLRAFIEGNPRVLWLGLKGDCQRIRYSNREWPGCLIGVCASLRATTTMLILESETDQYPVYHCSSVDSVVSALQDCELFEYYVVDPELRWLVADTDHNELVTSVR